MSLSAAASGLVLFLLSLTVVQSQNDYAVTYTSTQICAVKGSTVDIGCSFKHPSRVNALKRVWFTKGNNYNPEDLKTDPVYAGRVSYSSHWKSYTLTIRDLRESDSAVYKFRFETDQKNFTVLPGVTLTVTALQVHVETSSYSNWATLTCQSSCQLHNHSSYIWYKNGHKISSRNQYRYSANLNPSDSYSCAVRGHEDFPSPSVCVRGETTRTVTDVQVSVSTGRQLDCVTRCNHYVSSYVWYKNGQQVNGASSSSYEAQYDTLYSYSYQMSYDNKNSYSCALKGFEDFHSALVCVRGDSCYRVNYSNRRICAVKGSSVDISCTYNSYESPIQSKSWFRSGRGSEDLTEDSQYVGRVEVTETERGRSTLRIRDLTESDSAEYHFKFKTQGFEWKSSLPGTTLTVTDLQVKVSRIISVHESQTEAELKCESSCSPAGRLSFVWFKNNQFMVEQSSYQDLFNPGDIISCAFKGHEDYRSDPVYAPMLPSVSVSPSGEIVEGGSVTYSSDANPTANYTWYKEDEDSEKASGHNFTITDFRPEHRKSVIILNIIRLTLVVLMLIALFVLGLWMRKKTHVALEIGPNESVNVIRVNTRADYENVSASQGITADDTEEQEELQ
ncbi:uncharacterized protein LOC102292887 isoform X3 [Haplochromis burtoni]|uniref:uncharacterized protein LOC102292887 isoform X3 n=1 Tax=Haplochromis burtoni TaxID=8153 RepID=UPI0003BDC577|nr:uncharacterized protein LOC102292887 isoform X3 [Haplochromis burtoni]